MENMVIMKTHTNNFYTFPYEKKYHLGDRSYFIDWNYLDQCMIFYKLF